jgi:RNA polymerase sigma factor (sigma-70 family)
VSKSPTPEQLLADAAWLKRLAVTLAGNEADADDLVQESWIAAWKRNPDAERPLRPWLAKVVRDVAGMKRRSERRRVAREEAATDRDAVASPPDALLDQMRLHRLLVDLVLDLAEPYRTTIIARFVEGRTAASIARSQRVPESTIRGRVREGLARLRVQLDEARGERKAWAPAVLAFANGGIQVAKTNKSLLLLLALLALFLGGAVIVAFNVGRHRGAPSNRAASTVTPVASGTSGSAADVRATQSTASWLAAMGDNAQPIDGLVVDEEGRAIAGATVELQGWASALADSSESRVTTGNDGRFRFQPRSSWNYAVVASAPGRAPATAGIDSRMPNTADVVLVLVACTSTAEGIVTDSGGGPIGGASVRDMRGMMGPFGPATSTAPDGRYSLCLSPGMHRLIFGADGYEHVLRVLEGQDRGRQRVDVELAIAATVTGRVIDESGTALPDVQVGLWPWTWESGGPAPRAALTDGDGRFEVRNVGAGRFEVTAWDRDHVVQGRQSVTVEAGREAEIVLRLANAVAVSGTVRINGKPLAGISVAIAAPTAPIPSKTLAVVTRDDGTFTAHAAAAHARARIEVSGYDVLSPRFVDTTHGSIANLVVDVVQGPAIQGQVVYRGQPVADAEVHVRGPSLRTDVRTDGSGKFEMSLEAGAYTLDANSDAIGAYSSTPVKVTAPTTSPVTIELDADARISGKVIDKSGAPVVGVEVSAVRQEGNDAAKGTTAVDGSFMLDQLAGNGVYKITVRAFPESRQALPWAGEPPAPVSMTNSHVHAGPLQLVVDRAEGEISGSVVDDTNAPVADAIVRVTPWAGLPVTGPAWPISRTDVDGHFRLRTVGPGPFTLEASLGNGPQATTESVPAGTRNVEIQLVRTGEVQGTLVGLPGARVWLQRSGVVSLKASYVARVDGDHFRATNLLPGVYVVAALSDSNPGATATVTVTGGAVTTVTLTASGTRTLEGRVLYFGGTTPVVGATCAAAAASGVSFPPALAQMARAGIRTATTDASGTFRIADAPGGDDVVFCTQTPDRTSGTALVEAGTAALVHVVLRSDAPSDVGLIMDWTVIQARVAGVKPESPAARAGIRPGDVVVSVDGANVETLGIEAVHVLITSHKLGTRVAVGFDRSGSRFVRTLTTVPFDD